MSYSIQAGIQISLDGNTWYALTDHNRQPIVVTPTLIEQATRMANGTMRKYVIASKNTFSVDWKDIPSQSSNTVDSNYSSAWLSAFYNKNVFVPIHLKFVHSTDSNPASIGSYPSDGTFGTARTNSEIFNVFITKFEVTTKHRNVNFDYVDMKIEFAEI